MHFGCAVNTSVSDSVWLVGCRWDPMVWVVGEPPGDAGTDDTVFRRAGQRFPTAARLQWPVERRRCHQRYWWDDL